MKLWELVYILKHFETCYPRAEVQLDLDGCEDPSEITVETDINGENIKIIQGNRGI
jgi:hypothetical protein